MRECMYHDDDTNVAVVDDDDFTNVTGDGDDVDRADIMLSFSSLSIISISICSQSGGVCCQTDEATG